MQKTLSIILIFVFSLCLFANGAYADCESKCCCKSAMTGAEQASHAPDASKNTFLQMAPTCCSGLTATACELTGGTAENLPKTFPASVRSELTGFSDTGLAAINLFIENSQSKIYARGSDPWLKTKPLPIYLQTHTFLC